VCNFITLVVATEDVQALDAVMRKHGRCAAPVEIASLAKVLKAGERQFMTNRHSCDCGTVFDSSAAGLDESEIAEKQYRKVRQLQKRGWSEGKIARWIEDTARAEARPRTGARVDSLELWNEALTDAATTLGLRAIGLFFHMYSGSIEDEDFVAKRRDCAAKPDLLNCLSQVREDELLMVQMA
jgi:hypothetical protein